MNTGVNVSTIGGDKERLRAWISEWRADRLFDSDTDERMSFQPCSHVPGGVPETCKVGCIYLLKPALDVLAVRPRYVAILSERADDKLLVVPYGRFGVPAIPGEISTGRTAVHVKVLCLWNARWVGRSKWLSAWEVARLKRNEKLDAVALYENLVLGVRLSAKLKARVGPVLRHPLDPRHEYIEEESRWVDQCIPGQQILDNMTRDNLYVSSAPRELRLAAEARASYRVAGKSKPQSKRKKKRK